MSAYQLDLDEAVILQDSHVSNNGSKVTLILTSKNLIQVNKGFFGGDKDSQKYPLSDLKELNGKPNVRIGKTRNGGPQVEFYFQGYERFYSFQDLFAERKWVNAVEKAYKSFVLNMDPDNKQVSGMGKLLSPLKDTIENAKRSVLPGYREPRMAKCPKCGAELVGRKGEAIRCDYCDTVTVIK